MTARSFEEALADSNVLARIARTIGITEAQARRFLSELAELPAEQAQRMWTTARRDVERQRNRTTRLGR